MTDAEAEPGGDSRRWRSIAGDGHRGEPVDPRPRVWRGIAVGAALAVPLWFGLALLVRQVRGLFP